MKQKTKYQIEGHEGEWTIKNSWVSDLGLIMVSFWNEEKKVTMNINTQTTLEQALDLPWVRESKPEETKGPDIDIIY